MFAHPRRARARSAATAAVTASALALCLAPNAAAQTDTTVEFSVSNITDFHGHIEQVASDGTVEEAGAAAIAAKVDELRGEAVDGHIHTTSGDNVGGSAFTSAILDDMPTLEALNAMGVDVSAAGNHEFDEGYDDLVGRISNNSNYPILGANVSTDDGRDQLEPYHIQTITDDNGNEADVAFIGTVTENTRNKVAPSAVEGVEFADPWETTNRYAEQLSDGNEDNGEADVVIGLFHEGASDPTAFNEHVDVVFAGDTHQVQQPTEQTAGAPVVMQAGEYGTHLGNANITVDTATDEVDVDAELITAPQIAAAGEDDEVAGIVAEAVAQAEEAGNEVVATIEHDFTRGARGDAEPGSNRGVESTLNNLIAEAQRSYMADFTGTEVDLGLMNAGGVRADLPAGEVTYQDAFNVQPFGNDLMYGDLTGADILTALEQQWKGEGEERPRLALGVSDNFSYTYDPAAPQGERIIGATINGEPLDPDATYTVAASTFLFEGGDGFEALTNVQNAQNVGVVDVTAFIDYLATTENVEPRWGQGAVGVQVDGDIVPGETVTLDLSSLAYTVDPQVSTVTATLATSTTSTDVDTTILDEGHGNTGTATLELTVPEGFSGQGTIDITTDAGTEVQVPVSEAGDSGDNSGSIPSPSGSFGSSGSVSLF